MSLSITSTVTLQSGKRMPLLGFGVYQSKQADSSVSSAIQSGYSHVDSARVYRNESLVCEAVHQAKQNGRVSDVWLTTKVTCKEHGTAKTTAAVDESVARAAEHKQTWDLFLLHDPCGGRQKRIEAWKVLEQKQKDGLLASIGVSNFSDVHLEQLKEDGATVVPDINQIELHPWCQQKPIVDYCRRHNIVVQAYCPLVRGERLDDPVLQEVAKETARTPAQVLVRWSLQKGFVPLPKSDTPSRIKENCQVYDFELSADQMQKLDGLDLGPAGACSWNPVAHE